jgi:zinc transport system substrate-binding protein
VRIILITAVAAITAAVAVATAACGSGREGGTDPAKLQVVAGFYPLAEAARQVGGDKVEVADLTPPGVEPHDLELSTRQVDRIESADVVLLLGGGFQPAVARAARRARGKVVTIDAPSDDPHIWLDPARMASIVDRVADAIPGSDRGPFKTAIADLDTAYQRGLAQCDRRVIVTAHAAFGHLANRYKLTQEPIAGISPEAEPDPRKLAELADVIRRTGTTTVFTEELVSPKVAKALAREAGVGTDVLDPMESGGPGDYTRVMGQNLERLRKALACR